MVILVLEQVFAMQNDLNEFKINCKLRGWGGEEDKCPTCLVIGGTFKMFF